MFIRPYLEKPTHLCTKTGALLVKAGPVFAEEVFIDVADKELFLGVKGEIVLRGCAPVQALFRASGVKNQNLDAAENKINALEVFPNRTAYLQYTTKCLFSAYMPDMRKGPVEEDRPVPFDANDAAMRELAKRRLIANWSMHAVMSFTAAARFKKASLARLRWLETGEWKDASSVR